MRSGPRSTDSMRAVLDPNVIVSAVLSPTGSPARLLRAWIDGAYELVVSPSLLSELERVLRYPKIATRVSKDEREELLDLLRRSAESIEDQDIQLNLVSRDPHDDYLIVLGSISKAIIVSGDFDLLDLADDIQVLSPASFIPLFED